MSVASYAVLTRAKAKFGKRLTEKDYKSLLDCGTVADVMTYLKSNTRYSEAFGEANERGIRRGLFERLLTQYVNLEFDTISRYELSVGEYFAQYIAHKAEVDEIVRILVRLNSREKSEPYNFTLPSHIAKKVSIDIGMMSQAENFEQVLAAMKRSHYAETLREYKETKPLPIPEIETKLYTKLYTELYDAIQLTSASEKEELLELFNTIIDYKNFSNIIRLKKYYKLDGTEIIKYLFPFGSLKAKTLYEMCSAENSAGVYAIMKRTRTGKLIDKVEYSDTGRLPFIVEFKKAKHNMYFSDSPAAVMMSYVVLCEIELHNLICIIEGARYNVDKSKIEPLLIY